VCNIFWFKSCWKICKFCLQQLIQVFRVLHKKSGKFDTPYFYLQYKKGAEGKLNYFPSKQISSSFTKRASQIEQNLQLHQLQQHHYDTTDSFDYYNQIPAERNSFYFPTSPSDKHRNDSITETNFISGFNFQKRKHRDSYTSLEWINLFGFMRD
jgi:hypothetical protein